jgi:PIN domain-containing protein
MLRSLGTDCWAVSEKFPHDIADISLFEAIRGQRMVFVTTDSRQRTRRAEASALRRSGVSALFIGRFFPKMVLWLQAAWLVSRWPKIEGFAEAVKLGTCAEISQKGQCTPFTI